MTKILLDKRQTEPDKLDDNPFDTSPKTETEAHIELGAQSIANQKVRHLQNTRKSLTFRQLATAKNLHPHFELEMPAIQGTNLGLFYFTVSGEFQVAGQWKKIERAVIEGHMIEVSAASKAEAERTAGEGIESTGEHSRRAFWAEEMGALDELNDPNPGLILSHDLIRRH